MHDDVEVARLLRAVLKTKAVKPVRLTASDTSITSKEMKFAQESNKHRTRLVIDPARGGDECCIAFVRGPVVEKFVAFRERDLMRSVAIINGYAMEEGFNTLSRPRPFHWEIEKARPRCTVDCDGLGAGLHDRLREMGIPTTEFRGSMKPETPKGAERYENRRAQAYFRLREKLMRGQIAIPDDPMLRRGVACDLLACRSSREDDHRKQGVDPQQDWSQS